MSDTAVAQSLPEQLAELRLLRREEFVKKADEIIGSRGSMSSAEADLRLKLKRSDDKNKQLVEELTHALRERDSGGGDSTVRLSESNLKLLDQVLGLKVEVETLQAGKGSGESKLPADLIEFAALMQGARTREGMYEQRFAEWECGDIDFDDFISYGKDALDNIQVAFNEEDIDAAKLWAARAGLWTQTALRAVKASF